MNIYQLQQLLFSQLLLNSRIRGIRGISLY